MCLSTITSRRTVTNLRETTVWKVFTISNEFSWNRNKSISLSGQYHGEYPAGKIGVWIKANKGKLRNGKHSYPHGFHGYVTARKV